MRIVSVVIFLLVFLQLSGKNRKDFYINPTPVLSENKSDNKSKTNIQGFISDTLGNPLCGATIFVQGSTVGTTSDINGKFRLQTDRSATLIISFVGYSTQYIQINNQTNLHIILKENSRLLEDVIVTALGLQRKEISLSYATEKVKQDELIRIKDPNMIVTLMGKISGLDIQKSASGQGGAAKVSLRGIRSVAGNNQPLYVIDGMPILNSGAEQPNTAIGGVADAGNRDGGDGISNINPEDVTSISILKGAPAAALYGTEAANGVILITTRKGESGKQEINFSSHVLFDQVICLPKFQHTYGVSDVIESWGPKKNIQHDNNVQDFFHTGITATNSISISTGKEQIQTYFSYANTTSKGVVPQNKLTKHNFNFRETSSLYGGRLKLDGNINLIRQKVSNRPVPGGFYMNPLVGLYRFPIDKDIREYRTNYEIWDDQRKLMVQNWHSSTEDFEQNPYWIINRIQNTDERNRVIASLSAKVIITNNLNIQARGTVDYVNDKFEERFYATTAPSLTGVNGRYIESTFKQSQTYADVIATYEQNFSKFSLTLSIGGSINNNVTNSLRYDSKTASLKYANVFNIANINMNTSAYIEEQLNAHQQKQSVFGTAQIGYHDQIFMDITARNDWSSTLAFTPNEKTGFFYPSFGMSWIINRTLNLPQWVSLGKIRAAWSKVGNDIPLYITNPVAHVLAGGGIQWADAAPFDEMKPESNLSFETGTEWVFFNNRLNFTFTYYNNHTRNQFFKLPSKNGDIYAYRYVNAGNIRNQGIELSLDAIPVQNLRFKWNSALNYSFNRNKIISLHNELPVFTYGPSGFSSTYAMKLKKGGAFGDIYGKAFKRDKNGKIMYETEGEKKGLPLTEGDGNTVKVGNANPRFRLSWHNLLSYKNLSFTLLIDGRFGGKVLSHTQADMDMFGVTKATGNARDRGYIDLEGQQITNIKGFYKEIVGGRAGITEYYMYSATNIRFRELSISYSLPTSWLDKTKVFKNVQLSFVTRNLCFLYKKAPFDPDLVLSTGNDNQAIDSYGMPTTRNIGFNFRFTF